jgi:hypothetical protein
MFDVLRFMSEGTFIISYAGQDKTSAAWGLTAEPRLSLPKSRAKKLTWRMAGADPAGAIPFPFEAAVTIKLTDSVGDIIWQFQGRQTTEQGIAIPGQRGIFLVFEDTFYDLDNTPFQQSWNVSGGGTVNFSRYYLFQDLSTTPSGYLTVAQQITQILIWAQACGVPIQIGTIEGPSQMPFYPARGLSCAAAIEKCLFCFPDLFSWIDDSTTPPTFNCRQRANLDEVRMPWAGTDAAGRVHKSSRITPLYKLQPSQVVLQYQEINTVNGISEPSWEYDAYPPGSDGKARRAMVVPIDLRGGAGQTTTLKETWTVGAFNPTSLDFWIGNRVTGQFGKIAALGDNDIANLAFADAFVCMSDADVLAHPNGISIKDAAGNYYGLAGLNEHKKGTLTDWLQTGGNAVVLVEVSVKASFSYTKNRKIGAVTIPQSILNDHKHASNVKLTNVPVGVTVFEIAGIQSSSLGELPVPDLARNVFTSLDQLQHDGLHEIREPHVPAIIGPWNVLTLTGGRADWSRMNIASVEIDFHAGVANAWRNTTITLGPARHLAPQDLNNYLQFFRSRMVEDNGALRSGGQVFSPSIVDMGGEDPKQDTVPSQPDQSFGSVNYVDAASGNTFSFQQDASTQAMAYKEYSAAGAQIGQAGLSRRFNGAGAPAAGTLPNIKGFVLYDLYVDDTTHNWWYCTAAGTRAAATWSQISSSGSGGTTIYDWTKSYRTGVDVIILQTQVINGILVVAGTYTCVHDVDVSQGQNTLNGIPQFPEPTAVDANNLPLCWLSKAFRPSQLSQCGLPASNWTNATAPINV